MKNPSSDSSDFHPVGVRVKKLHPSQELEFSMKEIPPETLVEMNRRRLKPILSIPEVEKKGRDFTLVNDFATTFDYG